MFIEIKTTIRNSKFLNKVVYTVSAVLVKIVFFSIPQNLILSFL